MGVREIEIFRVVMTTGSTSKAAGMLGISQPAVSQAIRKLESSAELQLFDRVRGRLIPTPEAQALMVDVDQFFVGFEMIEHRLKSLSHHGTDRLVVATHPALGYAFMPRALAAFHPAQRDLSVSLRILSSREVHQQVTSGLCDFGLMADEMPVAGLEHSHFMNAPGIIAMAPSHPLAARPMITPNDLSDVEFLALNPEDSSRRRLEQALQANGVKLKIRIETAYAHTLCEMAIHGLGVAFVNPARPAPGGKRSSTDPWLAHSVGQRPAGADEQHGPAGLTTRRMFRKSARPAYLAPRRPTALRPGAAATG